jgi:hypothetical protein
LGAERVVQERPLLRELALREQGVAADLVRHNSMLKWLLPRGRVHLAWVGQRPA